MREKRANGAMILMRQEVERGTETVHGRNEGEESALSLGRDRATVFLCRASEEEIDSFRPRRGAGRREGLISSSAPLQTVNMLSAVQT